MLMSMLKSQTFPMSISEFEKPMSNVNISKGSMSNIKCHKAHISMSKFGLSGPLYHFQTCKSNTNLRYT